MKTRLGVSIGRIRPLLGLQINFFSDRPLFWSIWKWWLLIKIGFIIGWELFSSIRYGWLIGRRFDFFPCDIDNALDGKSGNFVSKFWNDSFGRKSSLFEFKPVSSDLETRPANAELPVRTGANRFLEPGWGWYLSIDDFLRILEL